MLNSGHDVFSQKHCGSTWLFYINIRYQKLIYNKNVMATIIIIISLQINLFLPKWLKNCWVGVKQQSLTPIPHFIIWKIISLFDFFFLIYTCKVQFWSFCKNSTNLGIIPVVITSSIGGLGSEDRNIQNIKIHAKTEYNQ
jgi:hypothetical protein